MTLHLAVRSLALLTFHPMQCMNPPEMTPQLIGVDCKALIDWQFESQLLSWCSSATNSGNSPGLSVHQLVAVLEVGRIEFKIDPSVCKPVCGKSQDLHGRT